VQVVRFFSLGLAIVLLVCAAACGSDTGAGDPGKATEGTIDVSEVASENGPQALDEGAAASAAPSRGAPSEGERHDSRLMDRVRGDLRQGRDVVITSYVGLWYEHSNDPSQNLYWGALYGHDAMFRPERWSEIKDRLDFLEATDYVILRENRRSADPVITKVIAAPTTIATSEGSERSRIVVVYLVYRDMERAVLDMATHLKRRRAPEAVGDEPETARLLRSSYIAGYWGHNIYHGGVQVDDLQDIQPTPGDGPRGIFVVGCQSARWYPQKFLGPGIEPVLFTTTNMAPEAYIALALYDGIGRGLAKGTIRRNVAEAYRVYQGLNNRPMSLFVTEREQIEPHMSPL
jgi:hypothetical protein